MISKATLGRMPLYLRFLRTLPASVPEISATTLAKGLDLGEVQVRKDLASVCGSGKPKVGYRVNELIECVEDLLSEKKPKEAVIVGAGKLGMALLDHAGFSEFGLKVTKAFDIDPAKCGGDVLPLSELKSYCTLHQIELGILTVQPSAADDAAKEMIRCGIRAIWCFSADQLKVPEDVMVQYENLALSLAYLHYRLNEA